MNYRDRWATNEQGEKFLFTVEMQRELAEAGLPVEPASLAQLDLTPAPTMRYQEPVYEHHESDSEPVVEAVPDSEGETADDQDTGDGPETVNFDEPMTIQIDPQTGKYIGRMKWYNAKKGYGFIIRGAGEEIFFHKTGTVGEPTALKEGEWILYDVEETRKGPEATEVEPYNGDPNLLN